MCETLEIAFEFGEAGHVHSEKVPSDERADEEEAACQDHAECGLRDEAKRRDDERANDASRAVRNVHTVEWPPESGRVRRHFSRVGNFCGRWLG